MRSKRIFFFALFFAGIVVSLFSVGIKLHLTPHKKSKAQAARKNAEIEDLASTVKQFGLSYSFDEKTGAIHCANARHQLLFNVGSKELQLNGTKIFLAQPIGKNKRNRCHISSIDVEKTLKPLLKPEILKKWSTKGKFTIVIDPGHGGKAQGAENKSLKMDEKTWTLRTALRLKDILSSQGKNVFLTREKDNDMSLESRAQLAIDKEADLFVSIHYNASSTSSASGLETYTSPFPYTPSTDREKILPIDEAVYPVNQYDAYNTLLAFFIQKNTCQSTGLYDRGARKARFVVIRGGTSGSKACPSILIECGFISNPEEAKRIATEDFQQKLAYGIVKGIEAYINAIQVFQRLDKVSEKTSPETLQASPAKRFLPKRPTQNTLKKH